MVLESAKAKYIPRENNFYRNHYHHVILGLMILIVITMLAVGVVLYQVFQKPLPVFRAQRPDGQTLLLAPYEQPNLLPETILQWASKAAAISYTFDFVNYEKQVAAARPFYTADGWQDYLRSVSGLIKTIVQRQLIINGVVSGTPVISNQGPLPGKDYVWRIQIPFLVTYQSANTTSKRNYYVVITIVRVPTEFNPQGIGIDQFVMV